MSTTARAALIADTALKVIADCGLRGLTHRGVDVAADLPPGSSSYYFRTRAALVAAAVERLVELELADLHQLQLAERRMGVEEFAGLGVQLLRRWTTDVAWRHVARYELLLESRRRPEVRAPLHRAGELLRERFAAALRFQGITQPELRADWFAAAIDGLLLDALAGPASATPRTPEQWQVVARDLAHAILRDRAAADDSAVESVPPRRDTP
jgi:AcrR family transcriptional regulator